MQHLFTNLFPDIYLFSLYFGSLSHQFFFFYIFSFSAVEASEVTDGCNAIYILAVTGKDILTLELIRIWRAIDELKFQKFKKSLPANTLEDGGNLIFIQSE